MKKPLHFALASLLLLLLSCGTESNQTGLILKDCYSVKGYAQGANYTIQYCDPKDRNLGNQIDSILKDFDWHLSTYIDTSLISDFNASMENGYTQLISPLMERCFTLSKEVYRETDGAFNPTVFPLVKAWGFFKTDTKVVPTQVEVDSILRFTNFEDSVISVRLDTVEMEGNRKFAGGEFPVASLYKKDGRTQLDFNAIAQGLSVDVVGEYFESIGINDYIVEIGGEVRTHGTSPSNTDWIVAIERPVENSKQGENQSKAHISLTNEGLATSGNYRKVWEENGVKYTHTLDPETGYPAKSDLLSVTVVTTDVARADAYATAFMVMGTEKTKAFVQEHPELKVYLILGDPDGGYSTWASPGFEAQIKEFE